MLLSWPVIHHRHAELKLWFVELFVVDFEAVFVVGCGRADTGDDVRDRTQVSS